MGNKATKNYGIMSANVNAGAISIGDNSHAKNINHGIKTEEITSIIAIIQNNLPHEDAEHVSAQISQLKEDIEQGKVKPKKAEGKLVEIIEKLRNSETIVKKISSLIGTTAGILAFF
jgi:hypothetical protein